MGRITSPSIARHTACAALVWLFLASRGACAAPSAPEEGRYVNYLLLHVVGHEDYAVRANGSGSIVTITSTISDRGSIRASTTTLEMAADLSPTMLEMKRSGAPASEIRLTRVGGATVQVEEAGTRRTMAKPRVAYVGFQQMPAALQMTMMRYWLRHGSPPMLPILRASEKALPLEIRRVGTDTLSLSGGRPARLTRYTVANMIWGREILWMDDKGRLVALMTFAGGLPQEQILEAYRPAFQQIVDSGVRQQMANLEDLGREVRPEVSGTFAIVGARLIDGTGGPPITDSAVIVRDGRIAAAGARRAVSLPAGIKIVHAEDQSLLPGLWEMHTHYSGIEFGPAYLAAGITTARDLGGEFAFLTALRAKLNREGALGPQLLLAGLIDSGGPLAFGAVDIATPGEGVAEVDRYADAGFEQIKVYDQLKPDMLKAITAEAHRRGLTVTGHVPKAVDTFEGIADGMDQINHLQYVGRVMRQGGGPVDIASEPAKRMIALLKARGIVVDPTISWGEMASHPTGVRAASFEPGMAAAPYTLQSKYEQIGGQIDEAKWRAGAGANAAVIKVLYEAGVPIVAGADTDLPGYGLDRELELYVEAGLPPSAAIEIATLGSAQVMKLDAETGSIAVGKRADLMLVQGDPLTNISDIRRVTKVVRDGRLYDSIALGRSVGFTRTSRSIVTAGR